MATDISRLLIIAGSAGAHQSVKDLLANLTPALPIAAVIVFHLGDGPVPSLAPTLAKLNSYPCAFADDGDIIEAGRIYIAPPDCHLLITGNRFRLTKGPRVNLVRPAIDLAFRSGAVHWGTRVIGVLLSGLLDDGVAGLKAIKTCGGMTIVQNPDEAAFPEMPQNALRHVDIDHVLTAGEIGRLASDAAMRPAPPSIPVPKDLSLENALDSRADDDTSQMEGLGRLVPMTCPECNGPLWEIENSDPPRYRCDIGHGMTGRILMEAQDKEVEKILWVAYRALEEKARMLERMTDSDRIKRLKSLASSYQDKALESRAHAEKLRSFLLELAESKHDNVKDIKKTPVDERQT